MNISANPASYAGPQAAFTAATMLSAQGEDRQEHRRSQTLGAGLFSVRPLTGHIGTLKTIGRDTGLGTLDPQALPDSALQSLTPQDLLQASPSLAPEAQAKARSRLRVGKETHEDLEEYDQKDHTAWALPLSTIGGLVSDGMWVRQQLSPVQERIVRVEAEETEKKIVSETLSETQDKPLSAREKAQAEVSVQAFMADAEVKEAVYTLVRANHTLIEARRETDAHLAQTGSKPPSKPTDIVNSQTSSSVSSSARARPTHSSAKPTPVQNTHTPSVAETTPSAVSRVMTEMKVRAAYEDVVVAQGLLSRACGRFERAYPEAAPVVSKGQYGYVRCRQRPSPLGILEAVLSGMALGAAAGALVGGVGAIAGGTLGLIGASAMEQTVGAGTEVVLNKAYALSQTARECLDLLAGILMIRSGRKLVTRQFGGATTPALKTITEPKPTPPPILPKPQPIPSSSAASSKNITREQRWLDLATEATSRLPKEVIDHVQRHGGRGVQKRFGLELAHRPKQALHRGMIILMPFQKQQQTIEVYSIDISKKGRTEQQLASLKQTKAEINIRYPRKGSYLEK